LNSRNNSTGGDVIGGPGAVMVPAHGYESFAEAILKKLIIEIPAK
jgi:hypothetical protein